MPKPVGIKQIQISEILIDEERHKRREDLGDLISLAKSISENGLINPIIIDQDNNLIQGRRRIEAVKLLKHDVIDARFYEELSIYERRKIEIEEQVLHKKDLSWQEEVRLKKELHDLYLRDHESVIARSRGPKVWSQKDTAQVLSTSPSALSDDLRLASALEFFPELSKVSSKRDALRKMYRLREFALLQEIAKRRAVLGQEQDPIRLLHGDCLEILPKIKDESIDLVITDPPWGIDLKELQGSRSYDYKMFKDSQQGLYSKVIPELFRVMRDGSHLWLFFGIEFYKEIRTLLEEAGFDVRTVPCIWVKEGASYSDWEFKPMPQYEAFFFAVKNVSGSPKRLKEATSDIFLYKRGVEDKIHPTEKPLELMRRLIQLSSEKGELVLDPFAGSGSTLAAAMLLDRRALGIELDKDYCEAAKGRLRTYIVEKVLESDSEDSVEEQQR